MNYGPKPTPAIDRFLTKIEVQPDECWHWTAARHPLGYGAFRPEGRRRVVRAHRWSYEFFVGPIPPGLQIDHLCRNPRCVNPDHLEPVTPGENVRRKPVSVNQNTYKTHCQQGHEFSPENTHIAPNGQRICRACRRNRARKPATQRSV